MRLITNKLFPEIFLTADIEQFALTELHKLKSLKNPAKPKSPAEEPVSGQKRPREAETNETAKIKTENGEFTVHIPFQASEPLVYRISPLLRKVVYHLALSL